MNNLNSVIISRVPRILTSQNRFELLHDEIFNIDIFFDNNSEKKKMKLDMKMKETRTKGVHRNVNQIILRLEGFKIK